MDADRGVAAAVGAWALVAGGVVPTSALAALAVVGSLLVGATAGLVALTLDVVLVAALVAVSAFSAVARTCSSSWAVGRCTG